MIYTTAAPSVNVDALNAALASPPFFWISIGVILFLLPITLAQALTKGWLLPEKMMPVLAAATAITLGGVLVGLAQTPEREPTIRAAFGEEYPGLTLNDGDLECIEDILRRPSQRAVVSCDSLRRVDGVLLKVNFTEFEGNFAVTLTGGQEIRSDRDLEREASRVK